MKQKIGQALLRGVQHLEFIESPVFWMAMVLYVAPVVGWYAYHH
jgi:hypothetical protein